MTDNIQLLLYAIPALVIAISLHEMMHSVVGYWLGDTTAMEHGRISINPLRHIDPVTTIGLPLVLVLVGLPPFAAAKPVPINMYRLKFEEFGMALVGIAGPLTNLLLAIISAILLNLLSPSAASLLTNGQFSTGTYLYGFLSYSVLINIGLFVFNLIPFPPLDGSRVVYALAPEPVQKVMMQIEQFGFGAIIFFMFVIFPFIGPTILRVQTVLLNTIIG